MTEPRVVMVVDDSEVVRVMLRDLLVRRGYVVLIAADGPEALALAETKHLDAVFTDLQLPGQSGIDLCRALCVIAKARSRSFPVWVMSGSDAADYSVEAAAAGAAGFFRKPFNPGEICRQLEQTLAATTANG